MPVPRSAARPTPNRHLMEPARPDTFSLLFFAFHTRIVRLRRRCDLPLPAVSAGSARQR